MLRYSLSLLLALGLGTISAGELRFSLRLEPKTFNHLLV
jgi:hypothetical protein